MKEILFFRICILKGKPRTELNTSSFNGTNIQEGKLFTLCCITESNPPADNIIWIKDLQKIKSKSNSNNCVEFLPIYREHAGNYTCIAKNTIGSSSVRQSVRVLCEYCEVLFLNK